jgi:hypothetical protein
MFEQKFHFCSKHLTTTFVMRFQTLLQLKNTSSALASFVKTNLLFYGFHLNVEALAIDYRVNHASQC